MIYALMVIVIFYFLKDKFKTKDTTKIYISENTYSPELENWDYVPITVRENLQKHFTILSEITKELKSYIPDLEGFFISSTWRPEDTDSPHAEGRAIDITEIILKNNNIIPLYNNHNNDYWKIFYYKCYEKFKEGKYNQIISPYGVIDTRTLTDKIKETLVRTHQDNIHLNIPS